jgi:hypothetical protein
METIKRYKLESHERRALIFVCSTYIGAVIFLIAVLVYVGRIPLPNPDVILGTAIQLLDLLNGARA